MTSLPPNRYNGPIEEALIRINEVIDFLRKERLEKCARTTEQEGGPEPPSATQSFSNSSSSSPGSSR